jgi:hypothetical protein
MINPQKGIDLMNNKSIINRILFAVTIFQHEGATMTIVLTSIFIIIIKSIILVYCFSLVVLVLSRSHMITLRNL